MRSVAAVRKCGEFCKVQSGAILRRGSVVHFRGVEVWCNSAAWKCDTLLRRGGLVRFCSVKMWLRGVEECSSVDICSDVELREGSYESAALFISSFYYFDSRDKLFL